MGRNFLHIFLLLSLSALIFSGCAKEDDGTVTPSGTQSPFTGHYKFQMFTIYTGETEMDIDREGKFNFSIDINFSGDKFVANISGAFSKSGFATGIIKNDTAQIGTFTGQTYSGEGFGYYNTSYGLAYWKSFYLY